MSTVKWWLGLEFLKGGAVLKWWEMLGAPLSLWLLHLVTSLGFLFAWRSLGSVYGSGLPLEQGIQER